MEFKKTDIFNMVGGGNNSNTKKPSPSGDEYKIFEAFGEIKEKPKDVIKQSRNFSLFREVKTDVDEMFDKWETGGHNKNKYKGPVFGNVNQFITKMMNDGRNAINGKNNIDFDYLIPNSEKFNEIVLNKLQFINGNDQQNARIMHFIAYKLLKKDPFNMLGHQIYLSIPFDNRISKLLASYSNICTMEDIVSLIKYFPLLKIDSKEFYTNVYDFIQTLRDFIVDAKLLDRPGVIIKDFFYDLLSAACTEENGSVNYNKMGKIFSTLLLENKIPSNKSSDYKTIDGYLTNLVFEFMDNLKVDEIEKILSIVNKNTKRPKHGCKILYVNGDECPNLYNVVNRMKLDSKLSNLIKYNK